MADNFLAKWLGRKSPSGSEVEASRADLQRLIAQQPNLAGPARWLDALLPDLLAPGNMLVAPPATDVARARLLSGTPLLRETPLEVNPKVYRRRWQHACKALARESENDINIRLAKAGHRASIDYSALLAALIDGRSDVIDRHAQSLGLAPDLVTTLLRCTVFPDFVATNAAWENDQSLVTWERGYCPTCGCRPLLGEFRGLEQIRYLRCGWCAASWKVPRFFCPDCGNRDHSQLSFFHREGEENHLRASTCQGCGHYLKMIATLSRLSPIQLWIADISTIHLDLAAAERGFV